ncbi:MAG: hypothetical protein AB7E95_05795 [Kiritimatiellales bacterium]
MKKIKWMLCAAAVLSAGFAGMAVESTTNTVDLTALAAQAAGMDKTALTSTIAKYKTMIADKMSEIDAVKTQLKGLSWKEMVSEKAKSLKSQLAEKTSALTLLKDTLAVYTNALSTVE